MNVTMPDGAVIEGVPEGITQSELLRRYNLTQQPTQVAQSPNILDRIGSDIEARKQQMRDIGLRNLNPLNEAAQIGLGVGQGVIGDVIGEVFKTGVDTLKPVANAMNPIYNVANKINAITPNSSGENSALSQLSNFATDKINSLESQYPNAATYAGGLGNLANNVLTATSLRIPAKALPQTIKESSPAIGESLSKLGENSLARQSANERYKRLLMFTDTASKGSRSDAAANQRMGKGIFASIKQSENNLDKKVLDATADLPLKSNDYAIRNKTIVEDANNQISGQVQDYLDSTKSVVNPIDIRNAIKSAQKDVSSQKFIGADENSKSVQAVFERARELTKGVNNTRDLYNARRSFDNWATAQKTENSLFGDGLHNSTKAAVNQVRRNLNDLIEKSIPDAQYKDLMRKHSGLIEAENRLIDKAAVENISPTAMGRASDKVKNLATLKGAAATAGLGGLAALAPHIAAPLALIGGGIYGAAKLGKMGYNAAAPALAKMAIKAGKALNPIEESVKPQVNPPSQLLLPPPTQSASQVPLTREQIIQMRKSAFSPQNKSGLGAINIPATPDQVPIKLLPSPEKAISVTPTGIAKEQTAKEAELAAMERDRLNKLGLTSDVRGVISRNDIRDKMGKIWDSISADKQAKIEKQINDAWKLHKPIDKIIEKARIDAIRLSEAKGEKYSPNAISEAMNRAKPLTKRRNK